MRYKEILEATKDSYNPPKLSVGDEVKIGKFKNRKAEITGFETDDKNQPVLKTTKGDQKLFKPRISKLEKEVEESTADGINKLFTNAFNPKTAHLQRIAELAMQGRQDEAVQQLSIVTGKNKSAFQKIKSALDKIDPVTIQGKIATTSQLGQSTGHQEWIHKTFIPWVSKIIDQTGLEEVSIDNEKGWGAVPDNQEVDYKGLKVMMKPSVFLDLAEPLGRDPDPKIVDYIAKGGAIGAPFLLAAIPPEWEDGDYKPIMKIVSHEGRNRMLAVLKAEGDNPVEVHIFLTGGMRNRHLTPEIIEAMKRNAFKEKTTKVIPGPLFEVMK